MYELGMRCMLLRDQRLCFGQVPVVSEKKALQFLFEFLFNTLLRQRFPTTTLI